MKLKALRAGVYATRRLQAGDVFDVPPVIAKIMIHQRRAEIAPDTPEVPEVVHEAPERAEPIEQIEPPPKPKARARRRAVPDDELEVPRYLRRPPDDDGHEK